MANNIIKAPNVAQLESLKIDPNIVAQYVSNDSSQVNAINSNALKKKISDCYTNINKRFTNLSNDFTAIKECVSGKQWINTLEKVADNCSKQGGYTLHRQKELEDAFNVDPNEEALGIMLEYLKTDSDFQAFYNSHAKGDINSVNFESC